MIPTLKVTSVIFKDFHQIYSFISIIMTELFAQPSRSTVVVRVIRQQVCLTCPTRSGQTPASILIRRLDISGSRSSEELPQLRHEYFSRLVVFEFLLFTFMGENIDFLCVCTTHHAIICLEISFNQ